MKHDNNDYKKKTVKKMPLLQLQNTHEAFVYYRKAMLQQEMALIKKELENE